MIYISTDDVLAIFIISSNHTVKAANILNPVRAHMGTFSWKGVRFGQVFCCCAANQQKPRLVSVFFFFWIEYLHCLLCTNTQIFLDFNRLCFSHFKCFTAANTVLQDNYFWIKSLLIPLDLQTSHTLSLICYCHVLLFYTCDIYCTFIQGRRVPPLWVFQMFLIFPI